MSLDGGDDELEDGDGAHLGSWLVRKGEGGKVLYSLFRTGALWLKRLLSRL